MKAFAIAMAMLIATALAAPAVAQDQYYFEYGAATPSRPFDPSWPEDGETWHELYPTYCQDREQTEHDDANGNGFIEECEHIWIDGDRHHVEWVGPTFVLESIPGRQEIYLEDMMRTGRQFTYHEIAPEFCRPVVTEQPIEFECQNVVVIEPPEHAGEWHVKDIRTDIRTEPDPDNPIEDSTWGKMKNWFRNLLGND